MPTAGLLFALTVHIAAGAISISNQSLTRPSKTWTSLKPSSWELETPKLKR